MTGSTEACEQWRDGLRNVKLSSCSLLHCVMIDFTIDRMNYAVCYRYAFLARQAVC